MLAVVADRGIAWVFGVTGAGQAEPELLAATQAIHQPVCLLGARDAAELRFFQQHFLGDSHPTPPQLEA